MKGWPYIAKEVVNVGTEEEPDYQAQPKMIWIPATNRGPYQQCSECRAAKAERLKAWLEKEGDNVTWDAVTGQPVIPKGAVKYNMHYSIVGAARCATHILRFHKKNGTLTDVLKADVMHRELINEKARQGAYYGER